MSLNQENQSEPKTRPYTRGMWYTKPDWTTDTKTTYYKGFSMRVYYPLIRIACFISFFFTFHFLAAFSFKISIGICFVITLSY